MQNKDIDKVKGTVTAEDIHPQAPVDKIKHSLRRDSIPKTVGNRSVTKGPVTEEDIQNQDALSKVKHSLRRDLIPKTIGNRSVIKEMSDKLKPFTTDNIFAGGTPGDSPNE